MYYFNIIYMSNGAFSLAMYFFCNLERYSSEFSYKDIYASQS
jgi:hypothetical protein